MSWEATFDRWLEPFVQALGNKVRGKWAPLYIRGLISPGDRKSVVPIAQRVAPKDAPQLHHFVSDSPWRLEPLEQVLWEKVEAMLGGPEAHLIVDDTALPKKGNQSVGVAHQYCGALGKQANCQSLVSITLAREEIPAPMVFRLYLPQEWTKDRRRCRAAGIPQGVGYQSKWRIALQEIDRIRAAGVCFGYVLADAGYGMGAEFRHALSERKLRWAVGILSTQNIYPLQVRTVLTQPRVGRPRQRAVATEAPASASAFIDQHGVFKTVRWRQGTTGKLSGTFAAVQVRPADGPETTDGIHLPGDAAWLVCERLPNGDRKYYLSNAPASISLRELVRILKGRWACEQMHQQCKEELGLDHFEGRSWLGLHHHALLTSIAFAFLQHLRLSENKFSAHAPLAFAHAAEHSSAFGSAAACA